MTKEETIQKYIQEDISQLEGQRERCQLNAPYYSSPIAYEAAMSYITGRLKTLADISSLLEQLKEES